LAAQLEILLTAKDNMSPAFKSAGAAVTQLGNAADAAASKVASAGDKATRFGDAANRIDAGASKARMGLSAMSQAANLVGADVSGMIGPMASAADAAGDLASSVGGLGLAAGAVGILVAAFALLNSVMMERNRAIAESILKNDEWVQSIERVAQGNAKATAMLQEFARAQAQVQTGWSWDIGDVVDRFERMNSVGQAAAIALHAVGLEARDLAPFLETSAQKAERLKNELNNLVFAAGAAGAELKNLQGIADAEMGGTWKGKGGTGTDKEGPDPKYVTYKKYLDALKTSADKAAASVAAVNAKLEGLVDKALNPTSVEQRLGMVGDAWDEFRLRLEAVATGTDPSTYGAEFVAQLDALGMSAANAALAFKDFSLFSDPANIKLVNMGPIVDSVKSQLDSMIGKANLTAAAMKEVWKNLSPQQKAALGAQGIDDATEAVAALVNPAGLAKTQVQDLGSALSLIPTTITTTFNIVKDAAEQAIKDFRTVLDQFIADYGSISISINAEATAGTPPTGATPPPTPPAGGSGGNFAGGLDWTVPAGFPNDRYPFRGNLSSGEHVRITPAGQSGGNTQPPTFIFYIDGERVRGSQVRMREAHGMFA